MKVADLTAEATTAEAVAERFADARAGFRLVDFAPVGLPYWRVQARAVSLIRKPMEPIDEFVLRCLDAGLVALVDIEQLLGIDPEVAEATLVDLVERGFARIGVDRDGTDAAALTITPRGHEILATLAEIQPEEQVIYVNFDGLLRRPVGYIGDWLEPREMREHGLREIPSSPVRGPNLSELRADLEVVQRAIAQTLGRREALEDLLAIKTIERRFRVYKPAVALVFSAREGKDVQVAFAVEGELSAEHEAAFARAGLARKLGIGKRGLAPAMKELAPVVGEKVLSHLDDERSDALKARLRQVLEKEGAEGEAASGTRAELEALRVRTVETYEHPRLLDAAMTRTRRRLVIVSPWIRRRVADHEFVMKLEGLLDEGVQAFIGWGLTGVEETDRDADAGVRRALENLARRYKSLRIKRLGQTHAKVLLSDDLLVVTSFNWLSFRGDPKRTFRDERGIAVTIPEYVDREFDKLRDLFR